MRKLRLILPAAVMTTWLGFGVAPVMASSPSPVYDSLPPSGTVTVTSFGEEALQFNQFGNEVILTKSVTMDKVSVTMVSFACQTGTGTTACTTTAGAQFPTPITLTIYKHSTTNPTTGEVTPGSKILTFTKTVNIGFRPSADPNCANPTQYKGSDGVCHNGARQNIVFNFPNKKLPATVVWGVTYNTDNQGPNPIGSSSPTDSLNVGVTPTVNTGLNRTDDSIFWDTSTLGNTCADPTNGNSGPFVTGDFNRDGPCDGTPNTWAGLIPAARFTPVG